MNLLSLLLILVVIGVILYIVEVLVPMDARIKLVIQAIVLVAVLFYILQAFGLISGNWIRLR